MQQKASYLAGKKVVRSVVLLPLCKLALRSIKHTDRTTALTTYSLSCSKGVLRGGGCSRADSCYLHLYDC